VPNIGEQGDVLRAMGRIFDEALATNIRIEVREPYLTVTYAVTGERGGHRYFHGYELDALRAKAQLLRSGGADGAANSALAESMRTIGQELDEAQIEMIAIEQDDQGFRVSGLREGRYHTQVAFWYEIQEASARHRAMRGSGGGRSPEEIDPFLGITVGAPILTRDDERVGKVGDIRGRSLKVTTSLFRKNYWLPAGCVAFARPSQSVRLSISKAEIEVYKRSVPEATVVTQASVHEAERWD
jgi:hypothetical protein